ncbi:MATE family efflux transporter [Vibrio gazogenes]|uniref:Multidrug resistance protein NorM n=1 Tax=Vibrio gazogenes TaxID=687 RepID=A0A1Z2SLJ6_VIBGA|nr:MATE family efflux transporter [Vibrio gazogenes]ASA58078.1 MATE family efflux transporter [Vibrio gazogenes]
MQKTVNVPQSLGRQLFKMTWPMVFGVLSLMGFQLVDSIFIAQLGVLPLAAQGFTLPMQMVIIGLQVGLGIATTSVIARVLGAGKLQDAKQLGGLILTIGSISVAVLTVLIYLLRHPILALLGATPEVFPIIDQYWIVWLISAWTGATLYFLYSICRANGNTILPGTMMMVTSLVNLILDPIFIFSFDLGINGAALATICAFGIGIAVVAVKVLSRHWMSFQWEGLDIRASVKSILQVMGPATVSQLLPPVSSMMATHILASFGNEPVAAWAVGSRFEFFSLVAVLALTMAMPPMVARMLGERKITEIRHLVGIAVRFVLIFQTVFAVLVFFLASSIVMWMADVTMIQQLLRWHLIFVPISLGPLGICMLMVSIQNALAKSYTALVISALRLFVFFLPCLWIGAQIAELKGIYLGSMIGNILAGLCAWLIYRRTIRQIEQTVSSD